MDVYERMNEALNYIEDTITGETDISKAAQIACCPTHQFQRFFAFISDMTLSEYIRRRRLSLAAVELQSGGASVLDIALKYGYESHAAFSRAFREQHGIAPSSARDRNAALRLFPRMSFQIPSPLRHDLIYRIEGGMMKMASVEKIEFGPFGPCKIVGREIRAKPMTQSIPALWGRCFTDGTYDSLIQLKEYDPPGTPDGYVGYMRDFDDADGSFTYVVGLFFLPNAPVPDGCTAYDVPACTLARAWIKGEEYDIYANAHALTVDAIRKNGHEPDWRVFFQCEVYTDERFGVPKSRGEKVLTLDYYMPCKP